MKEQKDKITEKEWYKKKIMEMVEEIDDLETLIKIKTVVKTHLRLLKEEERG